MSTSRFAAAGAIGFALAAIFIPPSVGAVDRGLGAGTPKPALGGAPWTAGEKIKLAADIDALLATAPTLRGAHVGLLAIDTGNGDVLYSRNADDAFVPASTFKVLTGSVALARLGPAFRFHTEAYLAPANPGGSGAARETLFLRAGGDPLLSSADLDALSRAAYATGTFAFPYPFLLDAGGYAFDPYPAGWSVDDLVYDYAPKLTPGPVDENALELTISPGTRVGAPLLVDIHGTAERDMPPPPDPNARHPLARSVADGTDRGPRSWSGLCRADEFAAIAPPGSTGPPGSPATVDVIRNPPQNCIEVIGSLGLGAKPQSIDVAMPEPTGVLYSRIAAGLPAPRVAATDSGEPSSNGVDQPGYSPDQRLYRSFTLPSGARLVWAHDGEPLSDLLADMWWPSDNFVAEMLLRAIGKHDGTIGSTDAGADAERAWLKSIGVDPATLTIADGSGLSTYDRITPRALVAILQADWNGPNRAIVLDDLPLSGIRGTLDHSFAGTLAERRTFAKTGSVSHARGLAGYLATLRHGAVTFAWSVDDWLGENDGLATLRASVLSRIIGD